MPPSQIYFRLCTLRTEYLIRSRPNWHGVPGIRGFEASPIKCYCSAWFPIGEVLELADEHD